MLILVKTVGNFYFLRFLFIYERLSLYMIQGISGNYIHGVNSNINTLQQPVKDVQQSFCGITKPSVFRNIFNINPITTSLSESDKQKYLYLIDYLKTCPPSANSEGLKPNSQLDFLLKNGKLLAKSKNDKTTTLDNLYDIATIERAKGLDSKRIITDTLDILVNPRYVTQNFGDIPDSEYQNVLSLQKADSDVSRNPSLMNINVAGSGTCCAASNEVNMADKYPAEFARWISKLSSKNKELYLNVDLKSISKDPLDAAFIMKVLGADNKKFGFKDNKIKVTLDDNAYLRAQIQTNHWDRGERNIADVLIQSAIMRLGSQNTYDSLTDSRQPIFNSNTQGLIEIEKTFVESLIKGKEITSLVYQKIDDNQNLVGYTCTFDKMSRHIIDTLKSGDDVIIGYILTNETAGITNNQDYNPNVHGAPNQVINGHEITIVDYIQDKSGKLSFVCIDTDDDSNDLVIYSADWLLPKIHHAGYPASIVACDEKEIMSQVA